MKPKIKNQVAWHQAEILMQPALIRVIDNIRKQVDQSTWQATYEEVQLPYPGYILCLKKDEREHRVDIWDLCYQVCFSNYAPTHSEIESQEVEIDTTLLDETGDVDWNLLEEKTKKIVEQVFQEVNSEE